VRLIKAFTHPLRVSILARLDEAVLSPKELAAELGSPLSVVSYHVKELARLEFIELVRTEQRRGAVQHWYTSKKRPQWGDQSWAAVPDGVKREIVGIALARLEAAVTEAASEGGFDRSDVHVSRVTLELDEQGWDELAAVFAEALDRVDAINGQAAARLAGNQRERLRATASMMMFEGPYGTSRARADSTRSAVQVD
jgi:DNA-binding transcriptional ArsR family regulator